MVSNVVRVHDGDTFLLEIDQGCGDRRVEWIRLSGIDVWEMSQQLGPSARAFCINAFAQASKITIQTFKTKSGEDVTSFIRYVADVWVDNESLAGLLRAAGFEKK